MLRAFPNIVLLNKWKSVPGYFLENSIFWSTDRENPDYESAELTVDVIKKLTPEIVRGNVILNVLTNVFSH